MQILKGLVLHGKFSVCNIFIKPLLLPHFHLFECVYCCLCHWHMCGHRRIWVFTCVSSISLSCSLLCLLGQSLTFNPEFTLALLVTLLWVTVVCLQSVRFTWDSPCPPVFLWGCWWSKLLSIQSLHCISKLSIQSLCWWSNLSVQSLSSSLWSQPFIHWVIHLPGPFSLLYVWLLKSHSYLATDE